MEDESTILQGHPAQEPEVEEAESEEGRVFSSPEEAEAAFGKLAEDTRTLAEEEAQLLEEQERREAEARADAEFRESARSSYRQMLGRVNDLDPDDDGYDDAVSEIMADHEAALYETRQRLYSGGSSGPSRAAVRRAEGMVEAEAIRHGLDPQDPLFLEECRNAPTEGALEDQIKGAITRTLKRQEKSRRKGEEPGAPSINSISDALEETEAARKLTLNDFQQRR